MLTVQMKKFQKQKGMLKSQQADERRSMEARFDLQRQEVERRLKALASMERRELAALSRSHVRDEHVLARGRAGGMPSLEDLSKEAPQGRDVEAIDLLSEFERALSPNPTAPPDLLTAFERAARSAEKGDQGEDSRGDELTTARPDPYIRRPGNKRDRDREQER